MNTNTNTNTATSNTLARLMGQSLVRFVEQGGFISARFEHIPGLTEANPEEVRAALEAAQKQDPAFWDKAEKNLTKDGEFRHRLAIILDDLGSAAAENGADGSGNCHDLNCRAGAALFGMVAHDVAACMSRQAAFEAAADWGGHPDVVTALGHRTPDSVLDGSILELWAE